MKKLLPAFVGCFLLWLLPAGAQNYNVTFTVDLGTAVTPHANGVHIAGDFQSEAGFPNDWEPGTTALTNVQGTNKYTVTVQIPAGTYNYKFVNGDNWGNGMEESIPSECASGGNRTLEVSGDVTAAFCYGSCLNECPASITYHTLTLNIDMRYNCKFNTDGSDSVDFAGPYNNWAGGDYLSDIDGDGIFSIELDSVPEGEFQYKARIIKNLSPDWESGSNKTIMVNSDTVAATRCFGADVAGQCSPIPAPGDVTFRVDLTEEVPAANIYLIGDFTNPPWQGGAIELSPVSGSPGVYEATVEDICPGTIAFKFVNGDVNTPANEEAITDSTCSADNGVGGRNRVFTRPSADPQLIYYKYNTCTDLTVGMVDFQTEQARMIPNPASNGTQLIFSNSTDIYTVSLFNLVGKKHFEKSGVSGNLTIERGTLNAGIYFVQITNAKGQKSVQKLIFN